jgi:glutamine amidotransferase
MCELFGLSARNKKNIVPYLKTFYSHSVEHPNGWGIGVEDGNELRVYKEPVSAVESAKLGIVLDGVAPAKLVLGHIRKATIGSVQMENCHPFQGRDVSGRQWTLIHNGTIFSGLELIPYEGKQNGSTDSERILLYLIDQINEQIHKKKEGLSEQERFAVVEQLAADLSERNKLNFLIYDGTSLYVHVNMRDTLFVKQEKDSAMFATVPLDEEGWENVPLMTVFSYKEGQLQYQGKAHTHEYISAFNTVAQQYEYHI